MKDLKWIEQGTSWGMPQGRDWPRETTPAKPSDKIKIRLQYRKTEVPKDLIDFDRGGDLFQLYALQSRSNEYFTHSIQPLILRLLNMWREYLNYLYLHLASLSLRLML